MTKTTNPAQGRTPVTCVVAAATAVTATLVGTAAPAQAENGDTHINGQGTVQTVDCNDSTLFVLGTGNRITAVGTCWAVTVQGSSNTVVADNVINDITVYGWDQAVYYKDGTPFVWDRGRELGMTNRIDRVPT